MNIDAKIEEKISNITKIQHEKIEKGESNLDKIAENQKETQKAVLELIKKNCEKMEGIKVGKTKNKKIINKKLK